MKNNILNSKIWNILIKSGLRGAVLLLLAVSCKDTKQKFDASGTFEATEIIVSAEATGKILSLDIKEGDNVADRKSVV